MRYSPARSTPRQWLLLLLSRFGIVSDSVRRHRAAAWLPWPLGFSRQEHGSGLPLHARSGESHISDPAAIAGSLVSCSRNSATEKKANLRTKNLLWSPSSSTTWKRGFMRWMTYFCELVSSNVKGGVERQPDPFHAEIL